MKNFGRALVMASRYWLALTVAIACSVGVATLWGANIAALFPILEVTMQGKSLQEWNETRIKQAHANVGWIKNRMAEIDTAVPTAAPDLKITLINEREALPLRLTAEQAAAEWGEKMRPTFARWLPHTPFNTVILIVSLVLVGTFFKHVLMLANTMLVTYVAGSIIRMLRRQVFDKALTIDRAGFLQTGTAGFSAQILHTTEMLGQGIMSVYGGAILEPLKILTCLAGAWYISWRLTVASLLMAPLVGFLILWLNKRIKGSATNTLGRSQSLHHIMLESFTNMMSVQANTMEDCERERFGKSTNDMFFVGMRHAFFMALTHPITELLGIGMVNIAIVVGAYLVIHQQTEIWGISMSERPLTITSMMVFFGLLIGAADPVRKLSGVWTGINIGMAASNGLFPMLDRKSLIQEPEVPTPLPERHSSIELKNVKFAYRPGEIILKDVNLTIPYGKKVAIVGPNGGGKSTLMNLVCRFYDPVEGSVLIDGIDLRNVSLRDIRNRIGLVTQHTELFNESILYNIRYGRWDATEEEIIEAAKKAHAHEFISGFPEGYQTVVAQSGLRLSGGQRQRIALARAILRDPEILILDEATSQIDLESERLIHDALHVFCRNRTVLMVTHRKSSLELADVIIDIRSQRATMRNVERSSAA